MDQNVAQAPTLGRQAGAISQGGGMQPQRRNVSQRGSGFTNLQQYVTANENNANPELVRQRTQQAGTGLQQAQTGFENVAQQARTGLQGIQGVNTFVQGVLADPTKAAADKANLQRFQALRTGQEAIANPNEVFQPFTQARSGFESQREQLAGGLRTDTTGTGLQNYIRSQRANPSLATQGENVLDRFLTESTTAGKTALQQAQERAGQIQATQIPGISGEVEALRQQVEPLQFITQQGIQSGIMAPVKQEQDYLNNLNKLYVARQVGIGQSQPEIESAKLQFDNLNKLNSNKMNAVLQKNAYDNIDSNPSFKNMIYMQARSSLVNPTENQINNEVNRIARQKSTEFNNEINNINNLLDSVNKDVANKYSNYLANIGNTRQQLLQQFEQPRLARINALSQLSGSSFQDLLNRGVS